MQQNERTRCFGHFPHGVEVGHVEGRPADRCSDLDSFEAVLHEMFELARSGLWSLKRNAANRPETIGILGRVLAKSIVVRAAVVDGMHGVDLVAGQVDPAGHHLNVDARVVHPCDPCGQIAQIGSHRAGYPIAEAHPRPALGFAGFNPNFGTLLAQVLDECGRNCMGMAVDDHEREPRRRDPRCNRLRPARRSLDFGR